MGGSRALEQRKEVSRHQLRRLFHSLHSTSSGHAIFPLRRRSRPRYPKGYTSGGHMLHGDVVLQDTVVVQGRHKDPMSRMNTSPPLPTAVDDITHLIESSSSSLTSIPHAKPEPLSSVDSKIHRDVLHQGQSRQLSRSYPLLRHPEAHHSSSKAGSIYFVKSEHGLSQHNVFQIHRPDLSPVVRSFRQLRASKRHVASIQPHQQQRMQMHYPSIKIPTPNHKDANRPRTTCGPMLRTVRRQPLS